MKRLRRMRATRHASKLTVTSGVAASRKVSSEPHVTLFTVHGFTRIGYTDESCMVLLRPSISLELHILQRQRVNLHCLFT